ncbi:MAG: hypothetical protein KKD17_03635, partial [Nanoarchaeota archaeon]|nr:hypothetical protein [Nanoarchaeota archaeon]
MMKKKVNDMRNETRACEKGFRTTTGIWRRFASPARNNLLAKMLTVTSLLLLMMLINIATALAYVQSHNL